jgi:hypothetical protein
MVTDELSLTCSDPERFGIFKNQGDCVATGGENQPG